jgi:2'-5' RNA ligase
MNDGILPFSVARIFLALWPDAKTQKALVTYRDALALPADARIVEPADLHMTVHFIGAVPRAEIKNLIAALDVPFEPEPLVLTRAALWNEHIAVLLTDETPGPLEALHRSLADRLIEHGLAPEERHYRPHVTLARRASGLLVPTIPVGIRWTGPGYVLAASERGYRILHRFGCA